MVTDATTEGQEVILDELPSADNPEQPSTQSELLTKEQAERLANERHSKLDKRISELQKLTERSTQSLKDAESRALAAEEQLERLEKAKEESEYEKVRSNPDSLSLFQERKTVREEQAALKRQKAEFERGKAEYAEAIAEATKFKTFQIASEIATKYKGVDATELMELTDGTPAKMEKMAARLGKAVAKTTTTETPFNPDSGLGTGGAPRYTLEQLEAMTEEQYAAYVQKRDSRKL